MNSICRMATALSPGEALSEETIIRQIKEELRQEITDPVKESTVEYYYENKDTVGILIITLLFCLRDFIT